METRQRYDVVVVGGGHNGLTAAALLGRAGLSVLVLERRAEVGGAAVSTAPFAGHETRLSRYSYLVSLMPEQLMADLDLEVRLASRRTASFTPVVRQGRADGLLIERPEGPATAASFRNLTGDDREYAAWQAFYADVAKFAEAVAPTLMEPLPRVSAVREQVDAQIWTDLVEQPLAAAIERRFADDTVRGVVATDALIGTFAGLDDARLIQNRCFLYHLIGNGTGEWRVPVGGMGAVSATLARAATEAGATIHPSAGVHAIRPGIDGAEVIWDDATGRHGVQTDRVLSGVAPWVLDILLGGPEEAATKPVGSQVKINLLLTRLPRLRSGVDPAVAFAGTMHLNEGYRQLHTAYDEAAAGDLPTELPGEIYCHSLTDPSIMGGTNGHTLTYFGLHTPEPLFATEREERTAEVTRRALASLNLHLAEPIEHCLARDAAGEPCLEVKIPQDIEAELAMPGGHIFHGDLEWPWVGARAQLSTPAEEWGVATAHESVLMCGSGARRGGAVSGIGGHNAAQAVLSQR